MRIRFKGTYLLLGILISALIFATAAGRYKTDRYQLMDYHNMVVKLDSETGNIEILNLHKDVFDGSRVPLNIIKVDCQSATYKKEVFSEE